MRTLRELAGWGLFLVVVLTPILALIALAALFDDGSSACGFFLFAGLLVLAWPRMWLTARRLRDPRPIEVAAADGRRPVLLLHRFARVSVSVWGRLLLPSPALLRDVMEGLLERKLERLVSTVGPLLPITRPPPPWLDDPAVPVVDPVWEIELERSLRKAAMAVIALDGSEANMREIERSFTILGPRTILVLPPQIDAAFKARYAAMRERIPLLPELDDPYARFIRYDASARAHLERALVILPEERVNAPTPPVASWLLTVLPVAAGFVSLVASPFVLEGYGIDLEGEEIAAWGFGSLVMGVVLAVLSRRAVRLVPINDAILVAVAASPWIVVEVISWMSRDPENRWDLETRLTHTATGAAYAAPLLTSVALMLAGASLIRQAPGRRKFFALIGAVSVLPFLLLASALGGARGTLIFPELMGGQGVSSDTPGILIAAVLVNAIAIAMAAWAASGDAARDHAPLPIGAAVAAALSLAACTIIASHEVWRSLFTQLAPADAIVQLANTPRLRTIERLWPWFVALLPAVIVWIGTRYRRRASTTAMASLAAFAPMIIVVSLAVDTETDSRRWFDNPYAGRNVDPLLPADGIELEDGFALPEVWAATPAYNHADVVIDRSGAIFQGRLVATAYELDGFRMTGGPPVLTRELAQLGRLRAFDSVRIATRRDVPASALLGVLASVRTAGWTGAELLVSSGNEIRSVPIRPHDARLGRVAGEIPIYLRLGAYQAALDDAYGTQTPITRTGETLDEAVLRQALATQQAAVPGRTTIHVNVDPSVSVIELVQGAAHAQAFFPTVLVADGAYSQ